MVFSGNAKRRILLLVILSVEIVALYWGQMAFYSRQSAVILSDQEILYGPGLAAGSTQEQDFYSAGEYLYKIDFLLMEYAVDGEFGQSEGGLTVNLRNAQGEAIASQYYSKGDLKVWKNNTFEARCAVTPGELYTFEAVADLDCAARGISYVENVAQKSMENNLARANGKPVGSPSFHMQLDYYYFDLDGVMVAVHAVSLFIGIAYCLVAFKKRHVGIAADIMFFCAAFTCVSVQLVRRNVNYPKETLAICIPMLLLMGAIGLKWREILFRKHYADTRSPYRFKRNLWKSYVLLIVIIVSGIMLVYCYLNFDETDKMGYFFIAAGAFFTLCGMGLLSFPRLNKFLTRFPWALYFFCSVLIFIQMEVSNGNSAKNLSPIYVLFNIITISICLLLLWGGVGNYRIAGLLGTALFGIWGIANYFTIEFRGIPISPNDLLSAETALNVLGKYEIVLRAGVIAIILLVILEVWLCFQLPLKIDSAKRKRRWLGRAGAAIGSCAFFVVLYFGSLNPLDMSSWNWNWKEGYYSQGYVAVSFTKVKLMSLQKPKGYSLASVNEIYQQESGTEEKSEDEAVSVFPNIIFIVNESMFDWRRVTDFVTDREVTPFIDGLDNCVKGFAVSPNVGGGTSSSEYELLTSNSLSMMPGITPFTQRAMDNDTSLVSYLKYLGYTTAAMHPGAGTNYNRLVVYPQLGFDRIFFSDENLHTDWSLLRWYVSDESSFEAIRELYETREEGKPAFIYNLTMQNHGGYLQLKQNGGNYEFDEAHTVKVLQGFENIRGEAEEYLSCLTYTDEAFERLLDCFSEIKEPTVICMVGDHSPVFSGTIESRYGSREDGLRRRGTPFVIWANYSIESRDVGYIGMIQLVPLLLQTADMPLSLYYQAIADLSEEYPVLGSAFYQKADGTFGEYQYTDDPIGEPLLEKYFYFEYNNLASKKNRIDELFVPR